MQSLKDTVLAKHNPDTLEAVRKEFDLHQPGRMDEAIDRLQEWIAAQPHFNKKDYSREYLEVFIINSKGSVEKAKGYIEKLCAFKTFGPQYFGYSTKPIDLKGLEKIDFCCLPRLTKENCRVLFIRNCTQQHYTVQIILNYLIKVHFMLEYAIKHNSYSTGMKVIFDFRKTDLSYFIAAIKYTESRNGFLPIFKGYATRAKSIHIISTSKIVDLLVSAVSQIISLKMLGRIHVHASIEELYEHFDKDSLPSDYGGLEKPIKELSHDWDKELSTDEFMAYIKEMFQATINPSLKPVDTFNDLYLGTQGTFRTLSID